MASAPDFLIYIQDACLRHQFIRSKDTSAIVERPERLRAVKIGVSAALAHIESSSKAAAGASVQQEDPSTSGPSLDSAPADDLTAALEKLNISTAAPLGLSSRIVKSSATVALLNNPAVKFVHGDIEGDVYLENLVKWANSSREAISKGESEIPSSLSQGDLYRKLCPVLSLPTVK